MRNGQGPQRIIAHAIRRLLSGTAEADVPFVVERPEREAYGDYATNVALKLAAHRKRVPIVIAEELAGALRGDPKLRSVIERISVAPPGFLNFSLSSRWLRAEVRTILRAADRYGAISLRRLRREKVEVEFISANPVGPLHLGNGRGGFLGDALANVLAFAGFDVTREYYVNDAGEQVRKFGASILAAIGYRVPYPEEELYRGDDIRKLGAEMGMTPPRGPRGTAEAPAALIESVAREASKRILADTKRVARKLKIRFDVWFSERSLHRQGFVRATLEELRRKRLVVAREGALWLELPALGEGRSGEAGRVLVKSSGEPTYVLADLAYHVEKFRRRKFTKVIDIWGADHHGHAIVLRAGLRALGFPSPDIILTQLVHLVERGERLKMSKRMGTAVSLEWLVDEVGLDVARWFFLERAPETHMEFDLALAKERSEKNPVFYVQYAHARCSAILRKAAAFGDDLHELLDGRKWESLSSQWTLHPSERSLIAALVRLPDLVHRIAETYEVHMLTAYATDVATAFSAFYRDCKVLTDDAALRKVRLALVRATQITLANTLGLLGIRAPTEM